MGIFSVAERDPGDEPSLFALVLTPPSNTHPPSLPHPSGLLPPPTDSSAAVFLSSLPKLSAALHPPTSSPCPTTHITGTQYKTVSVSLSVVAQRHSFQISEIFSSFLIQ
ncbi:unnamed protein product [Lactuca virosa]|uniref:Uncharacterized protein n=1 Tax=Lactuca virosa TaxID=75947 RepID=A0AAU9LRP3_9ASTR|nr:unnamed protein product [Lactuca virosa]